MTHTREQNQFVTRCPWWAKLMPWCWIDGICWWLGKRQLWSASKGHSIRYRVWLKVYGWWVINVRDPRKHWGRLK